MKLYKLLFCMVMVHSISLCIMHKNQGGYTIHLTPSWHNLESERTTAELFGGKWILGGTITLTKEARDQIKLDMLCLRWNGPPLKDLTSSLYKRKPNSEFKPIEENVVADGQWSNQAQIIKFKFLKEEPLGVVNTFYLVFTVPAQLESLLQTGSFTIDPHCLPDPFQQCACSTSPLSFKEVLLHS